MGPGKAQWACVNCRVAAFGAKALACPSCGRFMVLITQPRRRAMAPEGGPPALKAEESDRTMTDVTDMETPAEPAPSDSDTGALAAQLAALEAVVDVLVSRVGTLETALRGPFRASGPVDLPIVLRSWTSMRAVGSVDVAVVPGKAVPPAVDEAADSPDPKLAMLLRRLRDNARLGGPDAT